MTTLNLEKLTGKKWYCAVVIYFTALLVVLYYLGSFMLPASGNRVSGNTQQSKITYPQSKKVKEKYFKKTTSHHYDSDRNSKDGNKQEFDTTEKSGKEIMIMCLIFTTPAEYDRKGLAVKLTWAKRCNYYAFFYSKQDHVHLEGAYGLDIPDGREHLTAKTMKAFSISYEKYKDSIDWYLKTDDDTYFIMENLRQLLSKYDPNDPIYLGHKSMDFLKNGYNSGGAGYLLSKTAAKSLVEQGDAFPETCHLDGGVEDFDMGRCLETFRIFPKETRDEFKRIKFHADNPLRLLLGEENTAYQYKVKNYTFGNPKGIKVLSPDTVSFHYLQPGHMYMYDFLLYDLNRHGQN